MNVKSNEKFMFLLNNSTKDQEKVTKRRNQIKVFHFPHFCFVLKLPSQMVSNGCRVVCVATSSVAMFEFDVCNVLVCIAHLLTCRTRIHRNSHIDALCFGLAIVP